MEDCRDKAVGIFYKINRKSKTPKIIKTYLSVFNV